MQVNVVGVAIDNSAPKKSKAKKNQVLYNHEPDITSHGPDLDHSLPSQAPKVAKAVSLARPGNRLQAKATPVVQKKAPKKKSAAAFVKDVRDDRYLDEITPMRRAREVIHTCNTYENICNLKQLPRET